MTDEHETMSPNRISGKASEDPSNVVLVSARICPFVQRTMIVLNEKGLACSVRYIDLNDKPDWFLEMSPLGKVPVIRIDGEVFFESAVINELLDEICPNPTMLSTDSKRRARERAAIEFLGQLTSDSYFLMNAPTKERAFQIATMARKRLGWIDANYGELIWGGSGHLNLVDAAAAPVFQRFHWLGQIDPEFKLIDEFSNVHAWCQSLLNNASVQRSIDAKTHDYFLRYLAGRGSPTRDKEPSYFGRLNALDTQK